MFLRPAPGCAARHPGTLRLLSDSGEHVNPSPYWHRLIAAGAVVVCDPLTASSPAPETETASSRFWPHNSSTDQAGTVIALETELSSAPAVPPGDATTPPEQELS